MNEYGTFLIEVTDSANIDYTNYNNGETCLLVKAPGTKSALAMIAMTPEVCERVIAVIQEARRSNV